MQGSQDPMLVVDAAATHRIIGQIARLGIESIRGSACTKTAPSGKPSEPVESR